METSLFGAKIPVETKEVLDSKLERGEGSVLIQRLADSVAYGDGMDRKSGMDLRIEQVEDKLTDARDKRRRVDTDIERLEDELETLRDRRETTRTREERMGDALIPLEESLRTGKRVFKSHGAVERISQEIGVSREAVMDELKDRNPDVPAHAFESGLKNSKQWTGVSAGDANDSAKVPEQDRS